MEVPQFNRTFEALDYASSNYPSDQCVGQRGKSGKWEWLSTAEFVGYVNDLSRGIVQMGLAPGTKIAIAAYKNRWEWMAVDMACAQTGMISIPVYPTISADDYRFIFGQSEVAYGFVGAEDLFEKFEAAGADTETFVKTYVFDEVAGRSHWSEVFAKVPPNGVDPRAAHGANSALDEEIARRRDATKPGDMMTIIYTSGTTGKPKGVMLSHANLCASISGASERLPLNAGDMILSFLPLCHIFERTASINYLSNGCSIALTGTDNLGGPDGDLQAIKPHFFTTVPRLLEKVYEKIYGKGEELTGIKRKLFFWALAKTDKYDYQHPLTGFGASIADKLIFSKWREALGGRIKGIITGAAPCPHNILRVFSAAGIPVREAYGLTETSPGLTISGLDDEGGLLGTVGPAVFNVDLHIDTSGPYREGEGEILAHGPNVMMGYYKLPEATAEVFTELDGKRWFRTGDIGMLVKGPGGREFLKITDRKKELLKTSGGKYVAPAPIEGKFKEEFLIEHFMVVGDNRKFVSALIVPSAEALQKWFNDNGKTFTSLENAIKDDAVIAMYAKIIERLNPKFSHIEQIKKFQLIAGPWDVTHADGTVGELTPTMKLKRRVVLERYATLIDGLYV